MYRTYVNQMNLNGKLRKKLGGAKQGAKQKSGEAWPPLRIATGGSTAIERRHRGRKCNKTVTGW